MTPRNYAFAFERTPAGVQIIPAKTPVSSFAASDDEVDFQVDALINDLEVLRPKLKQALIEKLPLGKGRLDGL
jgi:hypothetical protein